MNLRGVGASILLLFLLVVVPAAQISAQSTARPSPPASAVVEVERVEQWGASYQSWYNLTWKLSAQDPDQSTGAFAYSLWFNGTRTLANLSRSAIPGRAGWVYSSLDLAASDSGDFLFQISANNTAADESILSCNLFPTLRVNGSRSQCGFTITAPFGVSLHSTAVRTEASPLVVAARWRLSSNDPDQTNGSFSYELYTGPTSSLMTSQGYVVGDVDPDRMATLLYNLTDSSVEPGASYGLYVKLRARDPLTHQISLFSCVANVQAGILYSSGACGNLPAPTGGSIPGNVTFPGLDVDQISADSGMSTTIIGGLLGAMLVLGFAAMGAFGAGAVGGGVGGVLALALVAALGLLPLWILVLVFLGAASVVVLYFARGS